MTRAPGRVTVLTILLVLLALSALVSLLVGGTRGLAGAALGGGAGLVLVLAGPWLLEPIMRRSPGAALPAAVGLYTLKAVAALVLLATFIEVDRIRDEVSPGALAGTLIVVAVAWTSLQALVFLRGRVPTYDLGDQP